MQKSQHAVQWRREASVSMGEWTIVFKMKCGERYHCTTLVAANECVSRELVLTWVPASQTQRRPEIRIIVQQKLKHEIISAQRGLSNGVCLIRICHIHLKRVPCKYVPKNLPAIHSVVHSTGEVKMSENEVVWLGTASSAPFPLYFLNQKVALAYRGFIFDFTAFC